MTCFGLAKLLVLIWASSLKVDMESKSTNSLSKLKTLKLLVYVK